MAQNPCAPSPLNDSQNTFGVSATIRTSGTSHNHRSPSIRRCGAAVGDGVGGVPLRAVVRCDRVARCAGAGAGTGRTGRCAVVATGEIVRRGHLGYPSLGVTLGLGVGLDLSQRMSAPYAVHVRPFVLGQYPSSTFLIPRWGLSVEVRKVKGMSAREGG